MLSLFVAVYGMVFLTELIGDRTFLTISALATRSRPGPLLGGVTAAFMLKMLAAVLLGRVIAALPGGLVAGLSAATFFAIAVALWRKKPEAQRKEPAPARPWSGVAFAGFAAIFCSEWGDVGQITAATLAARSHAGFVVWLAATLALVTKAVLALTVGVGLRRWLPAPVLRAGALTLCLVMGALSVLRIDL